MNAQDLILGARVAHVRELQTELARLKAEHAATRDELAVLRAHFDDALLAAAELRDLPAGAVYEIWDGWNLILGAKKEARDRADLLAQARARLADAAPGSLFIWIVLDGPVESVAVREKNLRVSYTGGSGAHRADRTIIDFVRMAAYLGLAKPLRVRTNDRDFTREIQRLTKE